MTSIDYNEFPDEFKSAIEALLEEARRAAMGIGEYYSYDDVFSEDD